jgi:hypothetical protein
MVDWLTGTEILEQLRVTVPSPEDRTWADVCAAAVNAGISSRLADAALVNPPPPELYAELRWAALTAGTEAYKRREAIFGLTGFVDMAGAAVRVSRDYLESVAPIIARYATVGLA